MSRKNGIQYLQNVRNWKFCSLEHWYKIKSYFTHIGSPSSYMTLQPIPSGYPYIWGKFLFLFYQCKIPRRKLRPRNAQRRKVRKTKVRDYWRSEAIMFGIKDNKKLKCRTVYTVYFFCIPPERSSSLILQRYQELCFKINMIKLIFAVLKC